MSIEEMRKVIGNASLTQRFLRAGSLARARGGADIIHIDRNQHICRHAG
jgi:hypothetical protein